MTRQTVTRYGGVAQAFHWLTAVLVLVAFIHGPGGSEEHVHAGSRDADRQPHETPGLIVLVLTAARCLWRRVDARPEPPAVARRMGRAARGVQGLLCVPLCAVPLADKVLVSMLPRRSD